MKIGMYQEALLDANQFIKFEPELSIGYIREAHALLGMDKFDEAIQVVTDG